MDHLLGKVFDKVQSGHRPGGYGGGPSGPPPPVPPPWMALWDGNAQRYYFVNQQTGVSSWTLPSAPPPPGPPPGGYGYGGGGYGYGGYPPQQPPAQHKNHGAAYGMAGAAAGLAGGAYMMHEGDKMRMSYLLFLILLGIVIFAHIVLLFLGNR